MKPIEMIDKEEIALWFQGLQDSICQRLEALDGVAAFSQDLWQRAEGGGGRTRVIQHGDLIEKGGVNFSAVHGPTPEKMQAALKLPAGNFFATGVSIVLHPRSPMVPIIHMNVRYFEINEQIWWFGGGIDLTPHYIVPEDAALFHRALKAVCDKHHKEYYSRFKTWADDYFFLAHRQETRGVGGIFFDRLNAEEGINKAARWAFVQEVGELFPDIYGQIASKNRHLPYGKEEEAWQQMRRARYVEFNLVWDKGTKFGLDTQGRTESILMSMPPMATWQYNYAPPEGSREAATLAKLKKGVDWAGVNKKS